MKLVPRDIEVDRTDGEGPGTTRTGEPALSNARLHR